MRFNIILSILSFFMTLTQITSFSEWWENSKVVDLTNDNFFNTIGKDKYVIVKSSQSGVFIVENYLLFTRKYSIIIMEQEII